METNIKLILLLLLVTTLAETANLHRRRLGSILLAIIRKIYGKTHC